ncbi:hypothetical protein OQA88_9902 [Cercophora sp. LCS_1]
MPTLPVTLAILAVLFFTVHTLKSWLRLRHIPGPPLAGISPLWMLRKLSTGHFHDHLRHASTQHGPLIRIGPNDLVCTSPSEIRRINSVRSPYTKGPFYETGRIIPGHDNIVSTRSEPAHKALRAALSPAYAARETGGLASIETSTDAQLANLIRLIDSKYLSTAGSLHPFDWSTRSHFFALDVISSLTFSKPFGFLTEDRDLYDYIEINDGAVPIMNMLGGMPWMTSIIHRWPLRLVLPSTGDKVGFGRLMGLAESRLSERLTPSTPPRHDMLHSFLTTGLSHSQLLQHIFVQIIAGSITTATALRHTLLAILTTPKTYAALQSEIDTAMSTGTISSPYITDTEASQLPYLQAVIREGIRMWPPTTGIGSKQVPPGGDVVCGLHVPGGTQVGYNFSAMMRLKSVFGEDAEVFRPERWLEGGAEKKKEMDEVVELAFGSGKFSCLGRRIAMMELNKVFFELLRRELKAEQL